MPRVIKELCVGSVIKDEIAKEIGRIYMEVTDPMPTRDYDKAAFLLFTAERLKITGEDFDQIVTGECHVAGKREDQ